MPEGITVIRILACHFGPHGGGAVAYVATVRGGTAILASLLKE